MTPSKEAKQAGLTSLAEASRMTGKSVQTLSNWYKQSPELFHIVILGCVKIKLNKRDIDMKTESLRSSLSVAQIVMDNLPEQPGYNGSVLLIGDTERGNVVKALKDAYDFIFSKEMDG